MNRPAPDPRLIVALDTPTASAARDLAGRLDPARCRLKVGKALFTAAGPALVEELARRGFGIFLDLKFHDIPATVAGACRAAADLGVWMVNVHASGGRRMLEAAAEAVQGGRTDRPLLTGVTVLTSLSNDEFAELGYRRELSDQVLALASLCEAAGLDGVVCSAHEVAQLRRRCRPGFRLVTPGIRPAGADAGDQRRTMTPAAAIAAGADYLVVGRPIAGAADPAAAVAAIEAEIASSVEVDE